MMVVYRLLITSSRVKTRQSFFHKQWIFEGQG
jgi:hypothetical protein